MQPVELMEGYVSKLKAVDKELRRLEKAAKNLATTQAETDETRIYLEAKVTDHRRDAAALESEQETLKYEWMESQWKQDVQAQREIQARRVSIDEELQKHHDSIRDLRSSLEALPSYEQEAVSIAAQLDALQFGDGFRFSRELETALLQNQSALTARQEQARSSLPAFEKSIYHEYRLANDEIYAQQQAGEELRDKRIRAKVAENERLTEAARNPKKAVTNDDGYVIGYR